MPLAVTNIDIIGWACFVVGLVVLGAGVYLGVTTKTPTTTDHAKSKLKAADEKLEEAKQHLDNTRAVMAVTADAGDSEKVAGAAGAAGASADAAKSALEEVQGIISSLPETLRFAGLLVLIGTVLMGVATVQFGGVSLF